MLPEIKCEHGECICSLFQGGFFLLYFEYWNRIIEYAHNLCSWL